MTEVPAPPLIDMPTELYKGWRRWLEEEHMRFNRVPNHPCWRHPDTVVPYAREADFYGCAACGRSHWCRPPYDRCPRITPPHAPGDVLCAISGRRLEAAAGVFDYSFDASQLMRARFKEHADREHRPDPTGKHLMHGGRQTAARLRREANWTGHAAKRRRLNDQADAAFSQQVRLDDAVRYTRLHHSSSTEADSGAAAHGNSSDHPLHIHGMDLGLAHADDGDADADGGGGGRQDYSDADDNENENDAEHGGNNNNSGKTGGSILACPPAEGYYDDAYLPQYLKPVAAVLAENAILFRPSTGRYTHGGATGTGMSGVAHVEPPRGVAQWRPLVIPYAGLLPHQTTMLFYIQRFVAHFEPLLTAATAAAARPRSAVFYMQRCDRLLLLHNAYAAVPSDQHPREPAQRLERLLFGLLTYAFARDRYRNDTDEQTQLFVWKADPWLEACQSRGLFSANISPETLHALPRGKQQPNVTNWPTRMLETLKSPLMSAVALYHYFNPHETTPGGGGGT